MNGPGDEEAKVVIVLPGNHVCLNTLFLQSFIRSGFLRNDNRVTYLLLLLCSTRERGGEGKRVD